MLVFFTYLKLSSIFLVIVIKWYHMLGTSLIKNGFYFF